MEIIKQSWSSPRRRRRASVKFYVLTVEIKRYRTLTGGYSFSVKPFPYLQNEDEPAGKIRKKCRKSDHASMIWSMRRHENSPFSDGTSAALFADKVLLKQLKHFDARIYSSLFGWREFIRWRQFSLLNTQFVVSKEKKFRLQKSETRIQAQITQCYATFSAFPPV